MKQKKTITRTTVRFAPGLGINVWIDESEADFNNKLPAMRTINILLGFVLININSIDIFLTPKTGKVK
jgi:hypothetical protein